MDGHHPNPQMMMVPTRSSLKHNNTAQPPLKHSWKNGYCSTLSVALLSIPFGVLLWYSSVGAFERLADRYLAALLLGLSD